MKTYFNEIEQYPSQWLRNLYPTATIDQRSIKDVVPSEIADFNRVHLFAGIGGWEYALQLAGWPSDVEVWTGSCPCQPFSAAGKRKGKADERHLWPEMFRLIRERRPKYVIGEQVPTAIGHGWLDDVFADLEGEGYACGATILGAHSLGGPHKRDRLWWVAIADGERHNGRQGAAIARIEGLPVEVKASRNGDMAKPNSLELQRVAPARQQSIDEFNPWAGAILIPCTDGKLRPISSQPGDEPLVNGIPRDLGRTKPELRSMAKSARGNRTGRLKGYGNAIVPAVAAVFIRAVMESVDIQ